MSLTAPGGAGVDFTSRVFPPKLGLDEDQVTGSAHAVLGRLWAGWLGRTELAAWQASARGGRLALVVGADTVRIGGAAVTTSRDELLVRIPWSEPPGTDPGRTPGQPRCRRWCRARTRSASSGAGPATVTPGATSDTGIARTGDAGTPHSVSQPTSCAPEQA